MKTESTGYSHSGSCMCGSIKFETTGHPFDVAYCHCESCRRHNATPVVILAGFKTDQVRFFGIKRKIYNSSPGVERAFCSNCGTPLTWEGKFGDMGQVIEIHTGAFDKPEKLTPTGHAFEPERIKWFDTADNLPRYEGFAHETIILRKEPIKYVPE